MTRRRNVILSVAAAAVVVLPAAADQITKEVIEHKVAGLMQCAAKLDEPPDVSLGGFPFLTQVATKKLSDVRVSADDVTVRSVMLAHVSAEAKNLTASPSVSSFRIDATVGYDSLTTLLTTKAGEAASSHIEAGDALKQALTGATIGADDSGRLVISASVPLGGTTMPVNIYADLSVADGKLTFAPAEVEVAAFGLRLPADRLGEMGQTRTIPVPDLPQGLTIDAVEPRPDGLRVVVSGTSLTGDLGVKNSSGTLPHCPS